MPAKRVLATAILLAALATTTSSAETRSEETFETMQAKLGSLFAAKDCDGAWRLVWKNRGNDKIQPYMLLSSSAVAGEHPWQPAGDLEDSEIAFKYAVLAYRHGQILSVNALQKLENQYEQDSLFLPLAVVEAWIQHLISNKESRYYAPSFETCRNTPPGLEQGVDNFDVCFGRLLDKVDTSDINETTMSPPDTHIQCSEKKLLDGFY
ncbi:hypothetical protein [Mesorhizobium neociceri]|uniref:Sel1 repeat family protein n=1 Tax=Mesorhizobium neociceri TaxID=1307853 RepID=A0A838BAQ2_9HYPH|nr:hypothetical protein [Mesorhizobium neociceri]MBA1143157.1 hypothetical protein [Mesorhizobium neociceri]